MQQVIAAIVYPFRVSFWISSLLGMLALVLTVSGIYGVMSYLVSQRTKEIGIRMALGANTAAVLWMVLKQSMRMAALGITAGVVLAAGASQLLASQMEMVMVNTFDVPAYAGGVMLVIFAAVVASYIPSHRAAQIDPSTTLRFE
jgi:ABC-type antimicrobial peptide transport system permease subunit